MADSDSKPIKALRFNTNKPQLHYLLFYPTFLEAFSKVQEHGADKYGYGNWTHGGKPDQEYLDSCMRHLLAHFDGEMYDEDLGTVHIAMAVWNLMNLIEQNYPELPSVNPLFDKEAFLERWASAPKNPLRK